jgi:hypothetical protein
MPKPLKEQLILNVNINKGGYNLRKKFQINQSLRINNLYGEATFVYISGFLAVYRRQLTSPMKF